MRTVTFSDERVTNYVNRHFVAVWKNIRPKQKFRDGIYEDGRGEHLVKRLEQGAGDDNICVHLATSDGKILHAVQGLAREDRFLAELKWAVEISELSAEKLKEAYAKRQDDRKDDGLRLIQRNLQRLAKEPLPSLDSVLVSDRAGLR